MEKRRKIILIAAMGVFLLAVGIGVFAAISEGGSGSKSNSTRSGAFTGSVIPLITVFIVFMQPTSPVNNSIYILSNKKYSQDQRAKYIKNYISKDLKASEKYIAMIGEQWPKYKKTEVKEKEQEKSIILLELVNGDRYKFEVIKRTKENSEKEASMWIINDYS